MRVPADYNQIDAFSDGSQSARPESEQPGRDESVSDNVDSRAPEPTASDLPDTPSEETDANLMGRLAELAAELGSEADADHATPFDTGHLESILRQSSNQHFSLLSVRIWLSGEEQFAPLSSEGIETGPATTTDVLEAKLLKGLRRCLESDTVVCEALGSEFSYEDPSVADDGFLIVVPIRCDGRSTSAVATAGFGATKECLHYFSVVSALIEHRLASHYLKSQHESILNEVIIAHSDLSSLELSCDLSSLELSSDGLSHDAADLSVGFDRSANEQFLTAYLNSPVAMLIVDRTGIIRHVNRYVFECLGYDGRELIGSNLSVLYGNGSEADIADRLRLCLAEPAQVYRHECGVRRADGSWLQIREITRVADGEADHCVVVLQDVTDTYRRSRELEYRANHDGLTGLVNRVEFERRMEQAIRAVSLDGASHTLCYLDLDHFKGINDSSGHNAGDEILKQMAQLFIGKIRQSDTIARLGGDEFAVLMEFCSLDNARRLAEEIRSAVANVGFEWQGRSFSTSVSIGMTTIDRADDIVADVMARADAACYAAKSAGRNQISVDTGVAVIPSNSPEQQRLIGLETAIADDGFEVYRQSFEARENPAYTDQQLKPLYEIQLRLPVQDGSSLSDSEFMSTVDNGGLNLKLDDWVVETGCRQLAEAEQHPKNEICWVNISRASVCDGSFADRLLKLTERYKIDPAHLCLSCTASVASSDITRSQNLIHEIRAIGCSFALDDFGAGTSFDLLRQFEIDYCRLSKSLTERIAFSDLDRAVVDAIVSVCRVVGVKTVAGHIKQQSQLEVLSELRLDYLQGECVDAASLVSAPEFLAQLDKGSASTA